MRKSEAQRGWVICKSSHSQDSGSTGPGSCQNANPRKHCSYFLHSNMWAAQHVSKWQDQARDSITSKIGLTLLQGSYRGAGQMRVSAGTTIAEQDCQVLDLSGGQERISILEEMRSEVEHWCHLLCTWRHYKRSKDSRRGSRRGWSGKPRCRVGLEPHVQPCTLLLQECLDLAKPITAEALFQALAGLLELFLCPVST